jgi:hypothetical protein
MWRVRGGPPSMVAGDRLFRPQADERKCEPSDTPTDLGQSRPWTRAFLAAHMLYEGLVLLCRKLDLDQPAEEPRPGRTLSRRGAGCRATGIKADDQRRLLLNAAESSSYEPA